MHNILLWALALCQLLSPVLALSRLWVVPTAGGYTGAFKGWTTFPLQSFRTPGFPYGDRFLTEDNLRAQARAQAQHLLASGYNYFMIDSGWSLGDSGDENGRIASNHTIFPNFPGFIAELHSMGLKVGVYIVPGVFASDYNTKKPIAGSSFKINDVAPSPPKVNNQGRVKIAFDTPGRTSDAGKVWVKSNVKKFADW
jgi:alpha-galactosidase